MSLLSIDISKGKRLSLKGIKLPPKRVEVQPIEPLLGVEPQRGVEPKSSRLIVNKRLSNRGRLRDLVHSIIVGENSYPKERIVELIQIKSNVVRDRAEVDFSLMLQAGLIEKTLGESYFLGDSTPF
jgi:hypothetical protein